MGLPVYRCDGDWRGQYSSTVGQMCLDLFRQRVGIGARVFVDDLMDVLAQLVVDTQLGVQIWKSAS